MVHTITSISTEIISLASAVITIEVTVSKFIHLIIIKIFENIFFAINSIQAYNSVPESLIEVTYTSLFRNQLNDIDLSKSCRGRALVANN